MPKPQASWVNVQNVWEVPGTVLATFDKESYTEERPQGLPEVAIRDLHMPMCEAIQKHDIPKTGILPIKMVRESHAVVNATLSTDFTLQTIQMALPDKIFSIETARHNSIKSNSAAAKEPDALYT